MLCWVVFFLLISTWIGIGFQEPDTEICASMLDALNECLQVCYVVMGINDVPIYVSQTL